MSDTPTILTRILETKQAEIAALLAQMPLAELKARSADAPPTRPFRQALEHAPGLALIAEVKKASPSKGVIRPDFDPVQIARAYHAGGAHCLSVLTDAPYFQGSLAYLQQIREAVPLPLLRKDFITDAAQIYQARLAGADAVLLIVAAVPTLARLAELRQVAESLQMAVLVEVHDRNELDVAIESGATLLGVNNRNLHTFEVRLEAFEELAPHFPPGALAVAESGIFTPADADRMYQAGAKAVLVGESLMRQPDVTAATRELLGIL